MRRSDRLTEGSRASQGGLGLTLPHCGAMGWGMIALSTVFFVMIVLQYGCVFLSGFLKSTKGVYSFTLQYWDQLWRIGSSTMLRSVEYALIVSIAGTVFCDALRLLHGPPTHPWPQPFRLPCDAALYAAGHVLRHRLHSRVQPRAAQADGHSPSSCWPTCSSSSCRPPRRSAPRRSRSYPKCRSARRATLARDGSPCCAMWSFPHCGPRFELLCL